MILYRQKKHLKWKWNFSRFAALLLLLYAFADISVLQEYCGNESLGIPSYAQKVQAKTDISQTVADISPTSHQEQTPDMPVGDEDCFCCCSHTLLSFNCATISSVKVLTLKKSDSNYSLKHRQTETHLSQLYQPPKFA
jgi:uncharacterized protein YpmS